MKCDMEWLSVRLSHLKLTSTDMCFLLLIFYKHDSSTQVKIHAMGVFYWRGSLYTQMDKISASTQIARCWFQVPICNRHKDVWCKTRMKWIENLYSLNISDKQMDGISVSIQKACCSFQVPICNRHKDVWCKTRMKWIVNLYSLNISDKQMDKISASAQKACRLLQVPICNRHKDVWCKTRMKWIENLYSLNISDKQMDKISASAQKACHLFQVPICNRHRHGVQNKNEMNWKSLMYKHCW